MSGGKSIRLLEPYIYVSGLVVILIDDGWGLGNNNVTICQVDSSVGDGHHPALVLFAIISPCCLGFDANRQRLLHLLRNCEWHWTSNIPTSDIIAFIDEQLKIVSTVLRSLCSDIWPLGWLIYNHLYHPSLCDPWCHFHQKLLMPQMVKCCFDIKGSHSHITFGN